MRLALNIGGRQRSAVLGTAGRPTGPADRLEIIGEPGVEVLPCPGCNRPLRAGTRRCPACGMRFLIGVQLREAMILLVTGFGLGLVAGGSFVTASVIAGLPNALTQPAATEAAQPAASDPRPAASDPRPAGSVATVPSPAVPAIPVAARSALLQTAAVNERLVEARLRLDRVLTVASFDFVEAAATIRVVASEATTGADQIIRLASWSRANGLAADLQASYDELRTTARAGLANSLTNAAAYRSTAEALRTTLGRLDGVDGLGARLTILLEAAGFVSSRP